MCGRGAPVYDRESVAHFVLDEEVQAPELPLSWNVAPTQDIYVAATSSSGARKLRALRWGLVPCWAKDPRTASRLLINARAETLAERPAYRGLLRSHRSLAVFSGFYEWRRPDTGVKAGKQRYYFRLVSGRPMAVAALWDSWHDAEGPSVGSLARSLARDRTGRYAWRAPPTPLPQTTCRLPGEFA